MLALALLPTFFALREWQAWILLRRFGVEVEGHVQHRWVGRIGLFDHYYVIYEFDGETPDGEFFYHSKHLEVDAAYYRALDRGQPLMVRYASMKPGIFRLKGQNPQPINLTLKSLLVWACAAFFILIAVSESVDYAKSACCCW
jgi:hypothetical protein